MNKIVTGLMSEAARQEATPFSQSTTELDTKKKTDESDKLEMENKTLPSSFNKAAQRVPR